MVDVRQSFLRVSGVSQNSIPLHWKDAVALVSYDDDCGNATACVLSSGSGNTRQLASESRPDFVVYTGSVSRVVLLAVVFEFQLKDFQLDLLPADIPHGGRVRPSWPQLEPSTWSCRSLEGRGIESKSSLHTWFDLWPFTSKSV